MRCFYIFGGEYRIRTGDLSERLRNALANIFPDQKLNIFPAFLPFNILFPSHCFAPGEILFCILYIPILCNFSVFGPATIMAIHPIIQILTVTHVITLQRFTINDVDKILHKKSTPFVRCFYIFGGEYRIRTGDLLPASKRITISIQYK